MADARKAIAVNATFQFRRSSMIPNESKPATLGRCGVPRHVHVRDPAGRSAIGGYGVVQSVEIAAGRIARVNVDLGLGRVAHVPLAWIDETALGGNVLPFTRATSAPIAGTSLRSLANGTPDGAA